MSPESKSPRPDVPTPAGGDLSAAGAPTGGTRDCAGQHSASEGTGGTRLSYLPGVKSVVVKLGTQLLSDSQGQLDTAYIAGMASQVVALQERGIAVTIVSSGAIGAGRRELNLANRPTDLGMLQAVAAVGQRKLMDTWAEAFEPFKLPVAQILLTREDIDRRARFLNLRNTIHAIHALRAIPIINENDTISTDELVKISFGDNDALAAAVTHALQADLLVLLTVVDGLLDEGGESVRTVSSIEEAQHLVKKERSALGKGGMDSKLAAGRLLTSAGVAMIVADGRSPAILQRLVDGEVAGTLFIPNGKRLSSRSRWIGSARAVGAIVVDAGAVKALVEKNRSLLPAGIVEVQGPFAKGDLVDIKSPDGAVIARGLCNYSWTMVRQVRGKKSSQVRAELGEAAYEEVVHRDNLVVC